MKIEDITFDKNLLENVYHCWDIIKDLGYFDRDCAINQYKQAIVNDIDGYKLNDLIFDLCDISKDLKVVNLLQAKNNECLHLTFIKDENGRYICKNDFLRLKGSSPGFEDYEGCVVFGNCNRPYLKTSNRFIALDNLDGYYIEYLGRA